MLTNMISKKKPTFSVSQIIYSVNLELFLSMQHNMPKRELCPEKVEIQSQASITARTRKLYGQLRLKIKVLSYYTDNTNVHGIKYLGERRRPIFEKIYWIIIFVVCFVILGLFISAIMNKWNQQFIVLVEDDGPTPVYKIPFPAVTICPQAKIKFEDFSLEQLAVFANLRNTNASAYENYIQKFQIVQQVCPSVQTIAEQNGDEYFHLSNHHVDLLYEISPSLSDIIESVEMPYSCEMKLSQLLQINLEFTLQNETFSTILTNEGVCFTYNLPADILRSKDLQTGYPYHDITNQIKGWDYEQGYNSLDSFPKVSCSAGEVSSLRIVLISSHPDIKTICQPIAIGYKIILHSPAIYPTTYENYIGINHESMTKIRVKPIKITTAENLRGFTPAERQCYFNDERYLRYYQFYNQLNCKLECFINYTIAFHGCVHFAFPRTDDIPICGARKNFLHLYEFADSIDSLINYLNDLDHVNDDVETIFGQMYDTCDCLIECNSIEYKYTVLAESFKNYNYHPVIQNSFKESNYSPTIIDIFWDEPKFVGRTRKQLYTFSDMVSNLGGLLGLFMGASVLSFFEVIYFCIVRRSDPSEVEHQQT